MSIMGNAFLTGQTGGGEEMLYGTITVSKSDNNKVLPLKSLPKVVFIGGVSAIANTQMRVFPSVNTVLNFDGASYAYNTVTVLSNGLKFLISGNATGTDPVTVSYFVIL